MTLHEEIKALCQGAKNASYKIGLASVFNFLFIIFEFLSVLKNMVKCKLPIPKKIQTFLEKALKEYTDELDSKKGV